MFEVETGIPIPAQHHANQRYPWHTLNVGESFFVPNGKLKSIQICASKMKAKTGHRYLVRPVDGGVRAWRLA